MTWQRLHKIGATAVALLLVAVVIGLLAPDSKTATAVLSEKNVREAVVDALTVTSVSVDCVDLVTTHGGSTVAQDEQTLIRFNDRIGALEGSPPRLWADALDTPFSATDPQEILLEAQAEICENPLYGVTVANMFANMSVGDVRVVDLNTEWLTPFAGDPLQINDKAAGFIPLLDVADSTDEQKQQAVTQNIAWQHNAELIGTLLNRFQVQGISAEGSLSSVLNYHLVAGGPSVGGLPEVGLNPVQEDLPALVLALTIKDACVPVKLIGLNIGDKRPEEFAPPVCVPPKKPTIPTPEVPGCKKRCGPTSTPETTPTTVPLGTTTTTQPGSTTTTVPGSTTTTTTPPGVVTVCRPGVGVIKIRPEDRQPGDTESFGKCTPPTQVEPTPTTVAPAITTTTINNGGQGGAGDGATNVTSPPTTAYPREDSDTKSPPTTDPGGEPPG